MCTTANPQPLSQLRKAKSTRAGGAARHNSFRRGSRARLELECLECRRLLSASPHNVILMIGDGMGAEQVEAGRYLLDASGTTPLSFETFPYQAEVATASANSSVTDSAAAATAMATGQKVNNGVISQATPGDGAAIQTSLERYQDLGKMTGLVTTTYMTHATPAAFGSHEPSRNNLSEIATDYLGQTKPNVLFGGGANGMTVADATTAGYTVVTTADEMQSLDTNTQTFVSGQFGSGHLPYEYDGLGELPGLSEMTSTALDILDNDPDGFFLVVEGGRIDHSSHDNDFARMQQEVVEFSNSVQTVIDWVMTNSGWGETLVVVTADHETGGLSYIPDGSPEVSWSTTGHTGTNVPIYARGANAHTVTSTLDNTEVFTLTTSASTIEPFEIVMLPDTQFYPTTMDGAAIFNSQTQWVADHVNGDQLAFVSHVGDIVRSGAAVEMEWIRADAAMDRLDGVIPYSAIAGNHDFDTVQDHSSATKYIEYFGPTRYAGRTWYGDSSTDQTSHYQTFTAGGREFLHLGLEWNPRPQAITWAQTVIDAHSTLPVILTTHNYLDIANRTSVGTALFNSLVTINPQIFMVICGHVAGENNRVVQNDAGLDVIEVLADYQTRANGGDGWLRLINFLPDDDLIEFQTYSPYREENNQYPFYETDADSQFTVPLDFDARLNFAPTASISAPLDNGPDDLDMAVDTVTVNTTQTDFQFQLDDITDSVDDVTVTNSTVAVTKDLVPMVEPDDYTFSYDAASDVITLTPVEGTFRDGDYQISLNGGVDRIADEGGHELVPTSLGIVIDTSIPSQQTATYQQGIAGYAGTVDTFLQQDSANADNSAAVSLNVDADDPPGTSLDVQALMRFDSIFGGSANQIRQDSVIVSATLDLQVSNPGSSLAIHRMLQTWSDVDTWNSLVDGVQNDGVEATVTADVTTVAVTAGQFSFDVTSSLAAWASDPTSNHGWVLLPTQSDGIDFDSSEGVVSPKLRVTFLPPAAVPQAVDDSYTVIPDQALSVPAPGLLTNDTGQNLMAIQDTGPSNGSLVLNANGSFDYTPLAGFHGVDSFTYYASNGTNNSNNATTTILVNNAPVANDDSFIGTEDIAVTGDVLTNDNDADLGDTLTATLLTGPTMGTVILSSDGTFTYTPAQDYNGADSFTYEARDPYQTVDVAAVTITIEPANDAPQAIDDTATTTANSATVIDVTSNDIDVDGDDLVPFSVDGVSAQQGTIVVNPDNTVTYTPPQGFIGTDSFSYAVTDGNDTSDSANVTVTVVDPIREDTASGETTVYGAVTGGDLSATEYSDGAYEVLEEELYAGNKKSRLEHHWEFNVPGGNTVELVVEAHRDGALREDFTFEYSTDGVIWSPALTVTKTEDDGSQQVALLPAATSGFVWVRVVDDDSSPKETTQDQILIDHLFIRSISGPPNDPPTAADDSYTTAEDLALSVTAPGVLTNDSDPNGDALTAILESTTTNGTLTLSEDGSFAYTPSADFHGTDSFTYAASDGHSQDDPVTVTINVDPINDAPVADHQSVTTQQDVPLPITLTGSDADGDTLVYVVTTQPANGTLSGTAPDLIYTPNGGYMGGDVVEFTVGDGTLTSATATVTITVNSAASGTKFFVVDAGTQKTFEYDSNLQLLEGNEWSVRVSPRGATSDVAGATVWVVDASGGVFVYDADGNSLGSWVAGGTASPEGIATNGTDIWIVDGGTRKLLYYENAAAVSPQGSMRPTSRSGLGAKSSPKGVTTDGTTLWIVDDHAGEIQEYSTDGTFLASWALNSANSGPTGITIDPSALGDLWVVDDVAVAAFHYALDENGYQLVAQMPLHPTNSEPQGIADPVRSADFSGIGALPTPIVDTPVVGKIRATTQPRFVAEQDSTLIREVVLEDLTSSPPSSLSPPFVDAAFDRVSKSLDQDDAGDFAWVENSLEDDLLADA